MDALPEIEQWRVTLTRNERLKLNHPTTVWRNYQKATEISEAKPAKPSKDDALRELDEERHAAAAEIERLKARIAELGACPNSRCSILSESDSTLGYEQVFSALEYRSDTAAAAECAGLRAERPCLAVYR